MDANRVATLFQRIVVWPKTKTELNEVTQQLQLFLDASFVTIWHCDIEPEELAVKLKSTTNIGAFKTDLGVDNILTERIPDTDIPPQACVFVGIKGPVTDDFKISLRIVAEHLSALAAISELKSAIALRDQFLSIASHELKTPLTSIYGVLQLQERMLRPEGIRVMAPDPEKQRSFLKIVIKQVERLNELIDGLLDISRIRVGRFTIEREEVDVAIILRDTVDFRLRGIARDYGVKITVEAPQSLIAMVDATRFEEVITNLGMNAIRFSPEGGTVWLQLYEEDGGFVFSVRDQGPTVSDEDRIRIFEPFEFTNRTGRLGGLGLGLYISKQIALLHGGDVTLVVNTSKNGNIIEAKFPRADVSQSGLLVSSLA